MAPKFSKLEKKVEELYINNTLMNTISNIIKSLNRLFITQLSVLIEKKRLLIRLVLI